MSESTPMTVDQLMEVTEHHAEMVAHLLKPAAVLLQQLDESKINVLHACVGICTEAGEAADAGKKYGFYNKPIDRENVVEELGDLEFYMQALRSELGITREETLIANMHKLTKGPNARYKNGYSDQAAIERADKYQHDIVPAEDN